MAKFIKVSGINEKWERKTLIINIDEIKYVDLNTVGGEAHIHLSDTTIATMDLKVLDELFEKEEPTYVNEELGITTDTPIDDFVSTLPHRYMEKVRIGFKHSNIHTVGDLMNSKQREIKKISGLGQGSFAVIMRAAEKNGINIPR